HAEANRARLLIRISLKHRRTGAKQFRFSQQLCMYLKANNTLVFHMCVLYPPLPNCNSSSVITTRTHCNIAGVCTHALREHTLNTMGVETGSSATFTITVPASRPLQEALHKKSLLYRSTLHTQSQELCRQCTSSGLSRLCEQNCWWQAESFK